jgi:nucleolar protein 56
MNDGTTPSGAGWFAGVERGDLDAARDAIEAGRADAPADWPALAVEAGFATDRDDYYDALREATVHAAREAAAAVEGAGDRQLVHAVRAMDDCTRVANELAERVAEWAGSRDAEAGTGIEYARELAAARTGSRPEGGLAASHTGSRPGSAAEGEADELTSLAQRVADLADEADALRGYIERVAPEVAPNLATMAGPVLAARLISLAGGLESLAKKPSGTVQVLGAEGALFAHLRGHATSPKHGVIFTHEYVRGTRPEDRGSAARALAGKLVIAARIDHYSGELRPEIQEELDERIATIRARGER